MLSCIPRDKGITINPFTANDFIDITFNLATNNGRFIDDRFADCLYNESKLNVFKIFGYNDKSFCWNDANMFSISLDGITIIDIIYGLEENQLFVIPCNILDDNFKSIFNEKNLLLGRYINNEANLEIVELSKDNDIWNIDEKYKGTSKKIPTSYLFEEFCK